MDAGVRSPLLEAEPFQTSQGIDEPSSPKELQQFYEDMEKRDIERRKSRGKTRRWSRKGPREPPPTDKSSSQPPVQNQARGVEPEHEWKQLEKQAARDPSSDDLTHDSNAGHTLLVADMRHGSIIPSRWSYQPSEDAPVIIAAPTKHRLFYQIHNPVGPQYYRNHHLRPLNNFAIAAAHYPPSAFSSSFPPLAALPAASPALGLGHAHLHPHDRPPQFPSPGTSGSSSESVPTPESSQSAFQYPKKNKQAPGTVVEDPVDQMDGSNPWGQKFHHDSPYDLGKKGKGKEDGSHSATWGGSSSLQGEHSAAPRSRTSILGGMHTSRKTTPSPLSQSTSAIHIIPESDNVLEGSGRKLNKSRRTSSALVGLFGNSKAAAVLSTSRNSSLSVADPPLANTAPPNSNGFPNTQSEPHLPTTPSAHIVRKPSNSAKLTNETMGSLASALTPSPEKEGKRTSVLSRMAKRFSRAYKSESVVQLNGQRGLFDRAKSKGSDVSFASETEKDIWGNSRRMDSVIALDPVGSQKRQEDERKNTDLSKRVPPPSIDTEESATSLSPSFKDPPKTHTLAPSSAPSAPEGSTDKSTLHFLPPISLRGPGLGLLGPSQQKDPHTRESVSSLDPHPWKLGKLTIANPDLAGSETDLSVRGDGDARSGSMGARMSPKTYAAGNSDVRVANGNHVVDQRKEPELPPLPPALAEAAPAVVESEPPLPPTPRAPSPRLADPLAVMADMPLFSTPAKEEVSLPKIDPLPSNPESYHSKTEPPPRPPRADKRPPTSEPPPRKVERSPPKVSSSSTSASRHTREPSEHEYHINVPVEGSLFARTAPGGGSAPQVEKPNLPSLPSQSRSPEPSSISTPRLRTSSKDTTIFTSIFATPSRKGSDSSPDKSSGHGHGHTYVTSTSVSHRRSREHVRTGSYSPEKPRPSVVYVRAGSESPDKEGRRERTMDRDDRDRERRREHRASERESEREYEDGPRRRERRDSSVRQREKDDSDRERERRKEERAREREERERARERERERDKERGRRREREREREEREREKAMEREEREREERERSRERRDKEKAREREKEKAREREKEKAKEREREKAREREKEKAREREKEKAREREREKEREREREKEREREREKEREREREKERERERRKEKESRVERETQRYRLVPRGRASSFSASTGHNHTRSDDTVDADDLVKLSALGKDWEVIESSRTRRRDRDDRQTEKARENGYATSNATSHRNSSNVKKESAKPNDSAREIDTIFASTSSRSGPRQRALSLEVSHAKFASTRPPTPPAKGDEPKSKREDNGHRTFPSAHLASMGVRPEAMSATTAYDAQRPTSGFHSASDLAMFKAKEAWERDRMWRGQSMTFSTEATGGVSVASTSAGAWGPLSLHSAPVPAPAQSYVSVNPTSYYHQPVPAHHGSSYTSFVVQPSWPYPQHAPQPPPPPPPPPIKPYSFGTSANPLPPPPRESTFDTRTPRSSMPRPTSTEAVGPSSTDH